MFCTNTYWAIIQSYSAHSDLWVQSVKAANMFTVLMRAPCFHKHHSVIRAFCHQGWHLCHLRPAIITIRLQTRCSRDWEIIAIIVAPWISIISPSSGAGGDAAALVVGVGRIGRWKDIGRVEQLLSWDPPVNILITDIVIYTIQCSLIMVLTSNLCKTQHQSIIDNLIDDPIQR